MPLGLELLSGQYTAPGATFRALTMAAGNSLTVRNTDLTKDLRLIQVWGFNNAAGIFRIRSPKLHDNVQGIRFRVLATDPGPLMPRGSTQKLVPQDTLIAELTGSAVAGQIETAQMLIYYADLPGTAARLFGWSDIQPKIVNITTNEVAVTPGVTGGYSGAVAINSTFDLLKANTDYAILGYEVDVACAAVRFTGPDFGNLGLGGPGVTVGRHVTSRWFRDLSIDLALPLIPVFNSANKAGTICDVVQNQGGAVLNVTIIVAELSGSMGQPGAK